METLLKLATLLGGVAAVWFFWDKLASSRTSHQDRKVNANTEKHPAHHFVLATIALGATSGVAVGVTLSHLHSRKAALVWVLWLPMSFGYHAAKRFLGFAPKYFFAIFTSTLFTMSACALMGAMVISIVEWFISESMTFESLVSKTLFIILEGFWGGLMGGVNFDEEVYEYEHRA